MVIRSALGPAMLDALFMPGGSSLSGTCLRIRTGVKPANCAAAATGTLLAECDQTGDWTASFVSGANVLSQMTLVAGTCFRDPSINTTGTAGYWRLEDNTGTVIAQGTLATTAAELIVNTVAFVAGTSCNITSFQTSLGGLI